MSRFPHPQLAHQWRQRLERFDQSELTVKEFCQLEGYSPASIYHWRRKLAGIASADAPAFVPVDLLGRDCQRSEAARIQVELPGGALILVPGVTRPDDYRNLIAAIVEATAKPDATHSCQ